MNVKAQGLLNAGKLVEQKFGREALSALLKQCSEATQTTYAGAIAINWHPAEELCELVDLAEKRHGTGDGRLAQEIGAAGARANLKGVLFRMATYVAKPSFLMARLAGIWRQFNDEGSMHLLEMSHVHALVEVRGVTAPNETLCHILSGWMAEVTGTLEAELDQVTHLECCARGDARCLWEVRGRVSPKHIA